MSRYRLSLPDSAYDVGVTNVDRPLRPPQMDATLDDFRNRNNAATIPIQLVGGAASIRALPRNLRRTGLRIQNLDATATLFYSIGSDQGANGFQVLPGGSDLYDFTTPRDEIYLYSTANIAVLILEMTRESDPPKVKRRA